jgi:hypothetical protein
MGAGFNAAFEGKNPGLPEYRRNLRNQHLSCGFALRR